ncbi:MAG: hypothetical protein KatS3mg013_1829 [Actinomycetota bacterium]|nr:MAG: hypothetical protein KatS3mg013_1829 [Actinomycetota bacterium]
MTRASREGRSMVRTVLRALASLTGLAIAVGAGWKPF